MEKKDYDLSRADLVKAHSLDPSNKAINDKLGQLRVLEKKHNDNLSKGLKKMFS